MWSIDGTQGANIITRTPHYSPRSPRNLVFTNGDNEPAHTWSGRDGGGWDEPRAPQDNFHFRYQVYCCGHGRHCTPCSGLTADSDSDPANASPATSPASLCLCLWPDNPVSKSAAAVCCLECGWHQTRAGLVQPSVPRLLPSLCLVMAMVISPAAAAQHDGWMIELQTKVWEDFTIPEKGVIPWLKVPTSSFTSRTLLRHYAMLNGWL